MSPGNSNMSQCLDELMLRGADVQDLFSPVIDGSVFFNMQPAREKQTAI